MTTNKGFGQDRTSLEFHGPGTGGKRREARSQAKLSGQHSTFREIGVGTNDPAKSIHILRETTGAVVLIERIDEDVGSGAFQGRKARGTEDARAAVTSGDDLLSITGVAYVGANNEYQNSARITYEVDGSVSDAAVGAPGRMTFSVSTGSGSSLSEKMRITSTGKVGLGMNNPSTQLTVEGAVTLKEQSGADSDTAAYGQVWVKTATPNELYFTTDAGDDIQITSGTATVSGGGDITSVVAGSGLTGGATSGAATVNVGAGNLIDVQADQVDVDLAEAAEAVLANGDYILFLDGGATGTHAKEAIADVASLFAGDGLTASSSVMAVNVDDSTIETSSDAIRVKDDGVTYAKIQNVSADERILGRVSGADGVVEELTKSQVLTMLNVADGATAGGEANEYSFKTISVSGESDVVADADDDTLTLVAGTGLSIATTADQITFTNTVSDTNTTYSAGDGLDLSGTTFSTDLKSNGGLVIESTELAVDLGASSVTGTLAVGDGGSGQTSYSNGQLLIGNTTGNTLAKATLTAGTGISITNGTGSVTITNTVTDTNTTYSAGTLLDLATTTFNVDLTEAAEAVMANGDYVLFLDGGATGSHAKEAIADVATLFAGDGLTASASVMAVNVDDSTIETSSDAIRIKDNGVTLAKMAGIARGKIIYGDASGDPAVLAVGDADQVLTTDGTDISWEDAGGGSGDITAVTIQTDSGSGSKASDTSGSADFILQGGSGVDVTNSGTTITVAGEDATTSNKGVASFHSDNFSVSSGAVTIKDQGVLYAEIQNVSATNRILGRDSSGAGVIEEITPANLRTMINVADGATAGGEANEYSFKTIAVSGQTNVVADTTTDTLTFAAAGGITITTTPLSDTVTISSADTDTTYSAGTLLDVSGTTFNVDLTDAAEAVLANGDYILFLDGGATGTHAKENIADVATLFAGDGLTASASVMAVNVDDSTIETSSDAIRVKDNGVTLAKMAGITRGSIIYGDASGDPAALGVGSNTYVLTSDGTDIAWAAAGSGSGDITSVVAGAGMTGGALSGAATLNVIGGDGITANADEVEVTVDGSTIELSASDGSGTVRVKDNGVTLAKMAGLTRGSIIYGDASGDPAALGVGSNTYVLTSDGTDVAWAAASGGSARSVAGDTDNGVITWVTSDNTFASEANMTFDGNTLALTNSSGSAAVMSIITASATATPLTIKGASSQSANLFLIEKSDGTDYILVDSAGTIRLGPSGTNRIQTENVTGTNTVGRLLDFRGGKGTGNAAGGNIEFRVSPAGSSGSSANAHAQALVIDSAKVLDFKIGATDNSAGVYGNPQEIGGDNKVLKIKVGGTDYFLPLYVDISGGP